MTKSNAHNARNFPLVSVGTNTTFLGKAVADSAGIISVSPMTAPGNEVSIAAKPQDITRLGLAAGKEKIVVVSLGNNAKSITHADGSIKYVYTGTNAGVKLQSADSMNPSLVHYYLYKDQSLKDALDINKATPDAYTNALGMTSSLGMSPESVLSRPLIGLGEVQDYLSGKTQAKAMAAARKAAAAQKGNDGGGLNAEGPKPALYIEGNTGEDIFASEIDWRPAPIAYKMSQEELKYYGMPGYFRIGYASFHLPPEMILTKREQQVQLSPLLRCRGSQKKGFGHATESMQLKFHLENTKAVNSVLLPILRQFEHTPFVPVTNQYLNTTLDTDALAMEAIQISTVPGFPGAMDVVIQASKYNWRQFMPAQENLDTTICYPLYKMWCETKTDTKPLPTTLDANMVFSIPNENYLKQLNNYYNLMSEEDLLATMEGDSGVISNALTFLQEDTNFFQGYGIPQEYSGDYSFTGDLIGGSTGEHLLTEAAYLNGEPDANIAIVRFRNIKFAMSAFNYAREQSAQGTSESNANPCRVYYVGTRQGNGSGAAGSLSLELERDKSGRTGIRVKNEQDDVTNAEMDEIVGMLAEASAYRETKGSDQSSQLRGAQIQAMIANLSNYYFVFSAKDVIAKGDSHPLARMLKNYRNKTHDLSTQAGSAADSKSKALSKIPMWEVINFDSFIVEQITTGAEHIITTAQPQGMESPVQQFMGSSDIFLTVSGTMKREADVEKMEKMLKKLDYLTQRYNGLAIGGAYEGYMHVSNEIFRFMGVTTVLPMNFEVRTIEGFPGEFSITLNFVAFDVKTKKREDVAALDEAGWYEPNANTLSGTDHIQRTSDSYKQHMIRGEYLHSKLRTLELYPDMRLPTYMELSDWVTLCQTEDSEVKGLSNVIGSGQFEWANSYESFPWTPEDCIAITAVPSAGANAYADPDFYCVPSCPTGNELISQVLDSMNTEGKGPEYEKGEKWKMTLRDQEGVTGKICYYKNIEGDKDTEEWKKSFAAYEKAAKTLAILADATGMTTDQLRMESQNLASRMQRTGFAKLTPTILKHAEKRGVPYGVIAELLCNEGWSNKSDKWGSIGYGQIAKGGAGSPRALEELRKQKIITKEEYDACDFSNNDPRLDPETAIKWSTAYLKFCYDLTAKAYKKRGIDVSTDEQKNVNCWKIALAGYNRSPYGAVAKAKKLGFDPDKVALEMNCTPAYRKSVAGLAVSNMSALDAQLIKLTATPTVGKTPMLVSTIGNNINSITTNNITLQTGALPSLQDALTIPGQSANPKKIDISKVTKSVNPVDAKPAEGPAPNARFKVIEVKYNQADEGGGAVSYTPVAREVDTYDAEFVGQSPTYGELKFKESPDGAVTTAHAIDSGGTAGGWTFTAGGDSSQYTGIKYYVVPSNFQITDAGLQALAEHSSNPYSVPYNLTTDEYIKTQADPTYVIGKGFANPQGTTVCTFKDTFWNEKGEDMFYDMRHYVPIGRILQSFPTYCMLLVDGGRWLSFWRVYDHWYGMTAVNSIEIQRTRNGPVDTAVVNLSNMFGHLSKLPAENPRIPGLEMKWGLSYVIQGMKEAFNPTPGTEMMAAWAKHASTMLLKPGARMHIRLGYGSNANKLPVVFNGTITEVPIAEEVVQVVALSDGIELQKQIIGENVQGVGNDVEVEYKRLGALGGGAEPRNIIMSAISPADVTTWAKSIMGFTIDNPYGIEHYGSPTRNNINGMQDIAEIGMNVYRADNAAMEGDSANAYSSMWEGYFGGLGLQRGFGGGETLIGVDIINASPWDVIETCTRVAPEYICASHPFELRSTLFYGKPHWWMHFDYTAEFLTREQKDDAQFNPQGMNPPDKYPEGWEDHWDGTNVNKVTLKKPYRQIHVISSFYNLVYNKITATDEDMFTIVQGVGSFNGTLTADGVPDMTNMMYLDTDILPEKQKILYAKTGLYGTTAMNWADGITTINPFMGLGTMTRKPNNNAAVSILRKSVMDMYGGYLVILGNPSIKPYDRCYLSDINIDMCGLVDVKSVTQHLSLDTGFMTTVTPDLVVSAIEQADQSAWAWTKMMGGRLCGVLLMQEAIGALNMKYSVTNLCESLIATIARLKDSADTTPGAAEAAESLINKLMKQPLASKISAWTGEKGSVSYDWLYDTITKSNVKFTEWKEAIAAKQPEAVAKIVEDVMADAKVVKVKDILGGLWEKLEVWSESSKLVDAVKNVAKFTDEATKVAGKAAKMAREAESGEKIAAATAESKTALKALAANMEVEEKALAIVSKLKATSVLAKVVRGVIWMVLTGGLIEWINRRFASRQCLLMCPLTVNGRLFVAGINGHAGCVIGDEPGYWDGVIASMTNWDYQAKHNQGWVGNNGASPGEFLRGLVSLISYAGGISPVGNESIAEDYFGSVQPIDWDNKARGTIGNMKLGNLAYSAGDLAGGFGLPYTDARPDALQSGHCGRYAHDLIKREGWVGPARAVGASNPSLAKTAAYRSGNVLTGAAANNIANLKPGMMVHLKEGSRYKDGHFVVLGLDASGKLVMNENLSGKIQACRPVSVEVGYNAIDWAVMPKYKK